MEIVDIPLDQKVCATCKQWEGARESAGRMGVRCVKDGEGVCQFKKHQNHSIIDAITLCENGENCPIWENWRP